MDYFFDSSIWGALTLLIFLIIYLDKNKKLEIIPDKIRVNFRFEIRNPTKTIFIPFIITFFIVSLLLILLGSGPCNGPILYLILVKSFFNPIVEEFLFRGMLFGLVFLTVAPYAIKKYLRINLTRMQSTIWTFFSFVVVTVYFINLHDNSNVDELTARIFASILYGVLYLGYKRNLIPPIVAHITNNLVIYLTSILFFGPVR